MWQAGEGPPPPNKRIPWNKLGALDVTARGGKMVIPPPAAEVFRKGSWDDVLIPVEEDDLQRLGGGKPLKLDAKPVGCAELFYDLFPFDFASLTQTGALWYHRAKRVCRVVLGDDSEYWDIDLQPSGTEQCGCAVSDRQTVHRPDAPVFEREADDGVCFIFQVI